MGVAGRQAKTGRAKHKPLMILAYPKIGPSAVSMLGYLKLKANAYCLSNLTPKTERVIFRYFLFRQFGVSCWHEVI